jgi:hypothetical protein
MIRSEEKKLSNMLSKMKKLHDRYKTIFCENRGYIPDLRSASMIIFRGTAEKCPTPRNKELGLFIAFPLDALVINGGIFMFPGEQASFAGCLRSPLLANDARQTKMRKDSR